MIKKILPICKHSGRKLTTPERVELGLGNSNKSWRFCLNPAPLLQTVVCRCKECKECPKFDQIQSVKPVNNATNTE